VLATVLQFLTHRPSVFRLAAERTFRAPFPIVMRYPPMTTSSFSVPGASSRITYARARLLLGISGVGASVLVAASVLLFDLPARLLSESAQQSLPAALGSIALALLVGITAFLPFDLVGGSILVRQRVSLTAYLAAWVRGAAAQWFVWVACAAALMLASRTFGNVGAVGAFVLLQLALAASRGRLAQLVASQPMVSIPESMRIASQRAKIDPDRLVILDSPDESFVGGWSGIRADELVVPKRWSRLPEQTLVAALFRRRVIAESGAHLRGVLGAVLWNTVGCVLSLALTGVSLDNAAGLLTLAAGMTLWAFVGVLVLPTPSRAAVFAIDGAAARKLGARAVLDAIDRLDRWQDDEPTRSARVETIFHPVPARAARHERLTADQSDSRVRFTHAHQLARHALWLNWASLSPLSRAVHCNIGRPALWVMLPGD